MRWGMILFGNGEKGKGIYKIKTRTSKCRSDWRGMMAIPNTYGYIRISTKEQNEERQFIALQKIAAQEASLFANISSQS